MKTVHLCTDPQGFSALEALPLPFVIARRDAFTDHDGKPLETVSQLFTQNLAFADQDGLTFNSHLVRGATTWRAVRRAEGEVQAGPGDTRRYFVFVMSGSVEVVAAPDAPEILEPFAAGSPVRNRVELRRGDVLFVDDRDSRGHLITYRDECCTVEVDVVDGWMPFGIAPPPIDHPLREQRGPHVVTLTTDPSDDDESMVVDWSLFPTEPGATPPRPIVGVHFVRGEAGLVSAWHTHATETFMICLTGESEVETGKGGLHRQWPGSGCYTNEFAGRGHVSRILRDVHMVDIVISDPSGFYGQAELANK